MSTKSVPLNSYLEKVSSLDKYFWLLSTSAPAIFFKEKHISAFQKNYKKIMG
jgi:hypothetical protein